MIGAIELARYTGSYWESGTPDDIRSAVVYFSQPHSYRWYELYTPSLETCRSETYTSTVSISVLDPGLTSISLMPNSGSVMSLAFDGLAFAGEPASITAGGRYDLVAPGGILPNEDVASVVDMPSSGPSVSNPAISSSVPPYVSQYHTFQWTPTGADWVLIGMTVNNGMTADGYESVYCAVADDGEFDFDGSAFSLWSSGMVAILTISAVDDQPGATLPWNQGESSVAAMMTTVGGAYTY
jgi:hypothetical protein